MASKRFLSALGKYKAHVVMVAMQFIYAGMSLLSKAAIAQGMKPSIFVAYRQAFATLALFPFAFFFNSQKSHPLTLKLLARIFFVSLIGMTLSLNMFYQGLNYTTATFAIAINNTIPALVFILAVCLRVENLAIRQLHGIAKVIGTVMGLTGAMVFTFYKGPPLYHEHGRVISHSVAKVYTRQEWIKGAILMLGANFTWALWLVLQAPILKQYPVKLRLTTLQCFFCCIVSTIYSACVERNIASWKIRWDVHLLAVAYCGIVVTGLTYWLQIWAVHNKGPVFASIFSPLALILTAVFSAILFKETLHWGSVLAAVLLIAGLYSFLWGKDKEPKRIANEAPERSSSNQIVKQDSTVPLECIVSTSGHDEAAAVSRTEANRH